MNRFGIAAGAALIVVATRAASATPVYDNLPPVPLGLAYFTDPGNTQYAVDDLHVVGGGELTQFSFAYGTEFFGGTANGNAEAFLYLDSGAGSPGVFDPADDTELFRGTVNGLTATTAPFGRVTFQTQTINVAPGVNIPQNANLWAGVTFTRISGNGNLHTVFFGPVGVGTTDAFAYFPGGSRDLSTDFPANSGLGFKLDV